MPASLPGETSANNQGNPALGKFVIMDPLSGPKGTPLDARSIASWSAGTPTYALQTGPQSCCTGAMCTGIGIGSDPIIAINTSTAPQTAPGAIYQAGFNDNAEPGKVPTYSAGGPPSVVASTAFNSTRLYIGGGRMITNPNAATEPGRPFTPSAYTAGIAICGAGQGGSRDTGSNTGFALRMVTAAAGVAVGAVVETGFANRSTRALVTGESIFGSATAGLAVAS